MISLERAKVLLAKQTGGSGTNRLLADAISKDKAVSMSSSPGGGTAQAIARDFGLRRASAEREGRVVTGLDDVLRHLHASPKDSAVTLFHFRGQDELFSLFIREADEFILGVIRLVVPHAQ